MNKIHVVEMLLCMIELKINQIQERFSNGEGLSGEDINTLLLKSQYNHINHLDEKLNEVTADVASLKVDFKVLEKRFDNLENKFENHEKKMEARFTAFENILSLKFRKQSTQICVGALV